jgi:N-methylhydantoinase B
VRRDVIDGYVSVEAARDVYGVVLDAEGSVDEDATQALRGAIREARIGREPRREVRADASPFAPLQIVDGHWQCGLCGEDLGDSMRNWRSAAVVAEREISQRFKELRLTVRRREQSEPVVLRENFCPGCASLLAVDVTLEGHERVSAARPGVNEPHADSVLV